RSGLLALRHLLDHAKPAPPQHAGPPAPHDAAPVDAAPHDAAQHDAARRRRWARALQNASTPAAAVLGELLRDYGIPAVRAQAAGTRAGAVRAAAEIGYPVVLKTDEPGIAHKSDVGGVRLGLSGPGAVGAAYDDLAARLGPRVLVCQTAAPGTELALGIARDPDLGPLIVVGAGGVLVEFLSERAVLLPPVTRQAALGVLGELRVRPLLAGFRGRPAADIGAAADAITALSALACELGDVLDALDINPLICGPSGAAAADVLVVPRAQRQAYPAGGPRLPGGRPPDGLPQVCPRDRRDERVHRVLGGRQRPG
ncbi:MAG: acetate--CoA ligase family protein, partial [Streptosporangiaceae bacterium]|nr:acetate--CoA ligase family protein [Streptosporangiaceae bacterium]